MGEIRDAMHSLAYGGSGRSLHYVVLQVTPREKFLGTGAGNLTELENVINE